jgi:hypothetical protein
VAELEQWTPLYERPMRTLQERWWRQQLATERASQAEVQASLRRRQLHLRREQLLGVGRRKRDAWDALLLTKSLNAVRGWFSTGATSAG